MVKTGFKNSISSQFSFHLAPKCILTFWQNILWYYCNIYIYMLAALSQYIAIPDRNTLLSNRDRPNAYMHAWVCGWMDSLMYAWINNGMIRCNDGSMVGCIDERQRKWMYGWMYVWMHGWTDGWMHGCRD